MAPDSLPDPSSQGSHDVSPPASADAEVVRLVPAADPTAEIPDPSDELAWLSHLLFDRRSTLGRSGPIGSGRTVVAEYLVHPSIDDPQLLVPVDPRAAATALGRFNDGMGWRKRLTQIVAQPVFRSGIGQRLASDRLWLTTNAASHGGASGSGSPDLPARLGELVGAASGTIAVTIGPRRANRKPVVQFLDAEGQMRCVAKVGWSPATSALVANEAWWLRRAAGRRSRALVVPDLISHEPWRGADLVVQSAVTPSRLPRGPWRPGLDPQLVLDVAALDPSGGGRWPWADVKAALARDLERDGFDDLAGLVAEVGRRVERRLLPVGAWHGDLTPWNLMSRGGLTTVIDWEFASDSKPVGWDIVNHHVHVGVELLGLDHSSAFERALVAAQPGLTDVGVPAELGTAVALSLLVELAARGRRLDSEQATGMGELGETARRFVSHRLDRSA